MKNLTISRNIALSNRNLKTHMGHAAHMCFSHAQFSKRILQYYLGLIAYYDFFANMVFLNPRQGGTAGQTVIRVLDGRISDTGISDTGILDVGTSHALSFSTVKKLLSQNMQVSVVMPSGGQVSQYDTSKHSVLKIHIRKPYTRKPHTLKAHVLKNHILKNRILFQKSPRYLTAHFETIFHAKETAGRIRGRALAQDNQFLLDGVSKSIQEWQYAFQKLSQESKVLSVDRARNMSEEVRKKEVYIIPKTYSAILFSELFWEKGRLLQNRNAYRLIQTEWRGLPGGQIKTRISEKIYCIYKYIIRMQIYKLYKKFYEKKISRLHNLRQEAFLMERPQEKVDIIPKTYPVILFSELFWEKGRLPQNRNVHRFIQTEWRGVSVEQIKKKISGKLYGICKYINYIQIYKQYKNFFERKISKSHNIWEKGSFRGFDNGVSVIGVLDARIPDTGISDTGISDSGISDSGTLDAGLFSIVKKLLSGNMPVSVVMPSGEQVSQYYTPKHSVLKIHTQKPYTRKPHTLKAHVLKNHILKKCILFQKSPRYLTAHFETIFYAKETAGRIRGRVLVRDNQFSLDMVSKSIQEWQYVFQRIGQESRVLSVDRARNMQEKVRKKEVYIIPKTYSAILFSELFWEKGRLPKNRNAYHLIRTEWRGLSGGQIKKRISEKLYGICKYINYTKTYKLYKKFCEKKIRKLHKNRNAHSFIQTEWRGLLGGQIKKKISKNLYEICRYISYIKIHKLYKNFFERKMRRLYSLRREVFFRGFDNGVSVVEVLDSRISDTGILDTGISDAGLCSTIKELLFGNMSASAAMPSGKQISKYYIPKHYVLKAHTQKPYTLKARVLKNHTLKNRILFQKSPRYLTAHFETIFHAKETANHIQSEMLAQDKQFFLDVVSKNKPEWQYAFQKLRQESNVLPIDTSQNMAEKLRKKEVDIIPKTYPVILFSKLFWENGRLPKNKSWRSLLQIERGSLPDEQRKKKISDVETFPAVKELLFGNMPASAATLSGEQVSQQELNYLSEKGILQKRIESALSSSLQEMIKNEEELLQINVETEVQKCVRQEISALEKKVGVQEKQIETLKIIEKKLEKQARQKSDMEKMKKLNEFFDNEMELERKRYGIG